MTLLRLFHSGTVTIVPQWHCYDCSTVKLLLLFHSGTVTIVSQWHCCNCSTMALLRLFHIDTALIVPQWHCYDCSTVILLQLFNSNSFEIKILWTVNFVPQWNLLLKNNSMYQEYDTWFQLPTFLFPVHLANITRYGKKYTILIFWTRLF